MGSSHILYNVFIIICFNIVSICVYNYNVRGGAEPLKLPFVYGPDW